MTISLVSASDGCAFDLISTSTFTPPAYNGVTPPLGGLRSKVTGCTPGETIQMAATFSNLDSMTAQKYGVTPSSGGASVWYTPTGLSVSGNTITFSVTDNGLGDDTFTGVDGTINDPLVPLPQSAFASESIPTLSEWTMLFMFSLMAMFGYTRLRNR